LPCHEELEAALAAHKGYQAALVFGSGYLANLGLLGALAGREDCIIADRLAHASILDGAGLSRARVLRFRHNDPQHLRDMLRRASGARRLFVVTESVFSMDGDLAPLSAIAEAACAASAMLIVDEAHATGVFGPRGTGLIGALGLQDAVPVAMGTLSKALGGYGGFVAGSEVFRRWLINRARAFIFSTSLPPASVGAALGALAALDRQPDQGLLLLERARSLRDCLRAAGFNTGNSASQIIPLIIGDNQQTLRFAQSLRELGILAVAIRPPTVPEGTSRLRLSLTLKLTPADIERATDIIITTARKERIL
jgi:8-amino-7-oxononanoate synthase